MTSTIKKTSLAPTAEAFTGLWQGSCGCPDARQMSRYGFLMGKANA